ncbi:MAG TPA: M23 family metallopeptidase [Bacteroidia bacterium]|nr:M23 family metallopeptidase [Bacteroidia bacterium]
MAEPAKKKSLFNRLRTRYFFIIRKEDTFEERFSLRISPIALFSIVGGGVVLLILLVIWAVAFTPLREYIPGYADINMRKNLISLSLKTDSLSNELIARQEYIDNIHRILSGEAPLHDSVAGKGHADTTKHVATFVPPSHDDSMLRRTVESQNPYNVSLNGNITKSDNSINDYFFFTPLKGYVSNGFNPSGGHYGIDIVSKENEAIKATLDGTVIVSTWTLATGNVIILQHNNNLVSVYEHNSVLLKKQGDYVKAGDVIAIVGNSGEMTTGPHLHFELWYKGNPVNPQKYMGF